MLPTKTSDERVKKIFRNTIKQMKALNVYKPEYDRIIRVYSQLCEQYDTLTSQFIDADYNCVSSTAAGGEKKDPLVSTLEALRKDILNYSDRLCLTPKSFDSMNLKPPAKESKLDKALDDLRNG